MFGAVLASILLIVTAFVLRPGIPAKAAAGVAAAGGAALASGALLVQPHASAADWILAVGAMAFLAPAHIRIVLGPAGALKDARLLAEDAQDA